MSIFKGRAIDFSDAENAIERCEVSVDEQPDKVECRFVIKMICRHGEHMCVVEILACSNCFQASRRPTSLLTNLRIE